MEQSTPLRRKNNQQQPVQNAVNPSAGFAEVPTPNGGGPVPGNQATPLKSRQQEDPRVPLQQSQQPPQNLQTPLKVPVPSGQSQGESKAERAGPMAGLRREFFVSDSNYKSAAIVFALLLVLGSPTFYGALRGRISPSLVGMDARPTLLGTVIFAVMGTLLYLLITYLANRGK